MTSKQEITLTAIIWLLAFTMLLALCLSACSGPTITHLDRPAIAHPGAGGYTIVDWYGNVYYYP